MNASFIRRESRALGNPVSAKITSGGHQDPEMQLHELREYSERRGWQIVETYVDNGVSGSKDSRPALNRLMADACQRQFDAFVVWKLDRFGRSLRHLVNALADFESLGIAFVSLKDNLDLSTPSGRLMFQIIGAMTEFERALIQERVRAGLRMRGQKENGSDDRRWKSVKARLQLCELQERRGGRSRRSYE